MRWLFLQLSMDLLKRGECQHTHGSTDTSVGETAVSISREDHVGSPHIFPSIVNYFLAKPFYSWPCSLVFMLGIVLIVNGILSEKLVEAQLRGWSMHSNTQESVTATVTCRTFLVKELPLSCQGNLTAAAHHTSSRGSQGLQDTSPVVSKPSFRALL